MQPVPKENDEDRAANLAKAKRLAEAMRAVVDREHASDVDVIFAASFFAADYLAGRAPNLPEAKWTIGMMERVATMQLQRAWKRDGPA